MKRQKKVEMVCPQCKAVYSEEPIIMINPTTGDSHMEHHLPKQCKYCRTNLVRHVTRVKADVAKNNPEMQKVRKAAV